MTPGDLLYREAAKWLEQADRDLTAAKALVEIEASRSLFHSQQAAEKAIKGFLTFRQILTDLGSQCAEADPTLEVLLQEVQGLTDYASAFRYPDAPYQPDATEAFAALTMAASLRDEVRGASATSGNEPALGSPLERSTGVSGHADCIRVGRAELGSWPCRCVIALMKGTT